MFYKYDYSFPKNKPIDQQKQKKIQQRISTSGLVVIPLEIIILSP